MDSIKNAIVTITLLAVGYGSYVVLQDDATQKSAQDVSSLAIPGDLENGIQVEVTEPGLAGEMGQPDQGVRRPAADSDRLASMSPTATSPTATSPTATSPTAASPTAASSSPLPASPFGQPEESLVAPPVANQVAPTAGMPLEAPRGPAPQSGPFAAPVVVPVDPVANLHGDDDAALAAAAVVQVDTATTAGSTELEQGVMDDALGPLPPANSAEGSLRFEQAWNAAQTELRAQQIVATLQTLSPWVTDTTLNPEQRERLLYLCDQLAGTVIYSREHHLEQQYLVREGETLQQIAAAFAVPPELLAKINGIAPPYALATGESLKVIRGPFRAELSFSRKELSLFLGTYYAGRFPVLIGSDLPPEESVYEVAEKTNGRSYFDRRSGVEVPLGDAANRYGNHWLGLRGDHITTGHSVGIHGRSVKFTPDDVGSISLDPLNAEDVYSILSVGSQIVVRP